MRVTKVKKQQWSEEQQKFVAFTLVMMHIMSDSTILEEASWFEKTFGTPGRFKLGQYWYPLIGGIAMDEQVFSWYCLQKHDEKTGY